LKIRLIDGVPHTQAAKRSPHHQAGRHAAMAAVLAFVFLAAQVPGQTAQGSIRDAKTKGQHMRAGLYDFGAQKRTRTSTPLSAST
jgi:hypothetical protein